jgi:hypothetical protein
MAKLHLIDTNMLGFVCPGCGYEHAVTVNGRKNSQGASWQWNNSMDAPTFMPSILCNKDEPEWRCHSWVKNGTIQFLQDCWHNLKGQTVAIPEWVV